MEKDPSTESIPSKSKHQVWEELIAAQALSGQKVQFFCKEQRVNYRVFYYWKKKLGISGQKRSRNSGSAAPGIGSSATDRFIVLDKPFQAASVFPRIHLPNGVRIELGEGLASEGVSRFLRSLCGVNDPPKDACPPAVRRGHSAKS